MKKMDELRQFKVIIVTPYDMKDISLLQYLASEGKDWKRTAVVMSKHFPKVTTSKGQTIALTVFDTPLVNMKILSHNKHFFQFYTHKKII